MPSEHPVKSEWGGRWDSNPQRPEPQSGALPIELHPPQYKALSEQVILNGTPEGIRTPDPQLRRLMLYPTELLAQGKLW